MMDMGKSAFSFGLRGELACVTFPCDVANSVVTVLRAKLCNLHLMYDNRSVQQSSHPSIYFQTSPKPI